MSIFDKNLAGKTKIDIAIERLIHFEPKEGYWLAFSGGKDSMAAHILCELAKVKFEAHYNPPSVDPPALIYFIRKHYPDVIWDYAETTMWKLIIKKKTPPTRISRYCCSELKEKGGEGRYVVTGVRWAESTNRKNNRKKVEVFYKGKGKKKTEQIKVFLNSDNSEKRRMFETCFSQNKRMVNPIIDWSDKEVWELINYYKKPYCELYDEGWERLGCIGCPISSKARIELEKYPKYKAQYIRTFEKMLIEREKAGLETEWKTGEEVLDWWLPFPEEKKTTDKKKRIDKNYVGCQKLDM